ncbi:MAG: 50S ribosomal protein L25 [Candidatus Dormibacteraeota bacterium]|nr:50S ribosomal protein L25 [Candidatus Dormibacteraeota bacterium]
MELKASTRATTGKASRRLRHQGLLPAIVYGRQAQSSIIELDTRSFERVFARSGKTQLIDLEVDGGRAAKVLVKEVQRSPRRNTLVHVDFHQVSLLEKLQVDVPLLVTGTPELVANGEADVLQVMHAFRVECLPTAIPESIEVDISGLAEIDAGIRVGELELPAGVTAAVEADELVVKLAAKRVAEVEEEVVAAEAAEEEAPAGATAEATAPE